MQTRNEFKNFNDHRKAIGAASIEFRTVKTRRNPETGERESLPQDEWYKVFVLKNKKGEILDYKGKPGTVNEYNSKGELVKQGTQAVYRLGQNTAAEVDLEDFTFDWVKSHKDTLSVTETTNRRGMLTYALCMSTAESFDFDD